MSPKRSGSEDPQKDISGRFEAYKIRKGQVAGLKKTILYAVRNENLEEELLKWCEKNDGQLYYAEPDSPDLIAISGIAAIVDRVFMGDSAWKGYCSYCEQLAYELSETSSEEISKYFPQYVDRSKLEDTPLIIADENLDPRAPEGPGIPKKDARDIFFIPVSKPQEIIEVLDQINLARKRYP